MNRIPIGLSVTASATINPAIAKSAIRRDEGSIGRSMDSQTAPEARESCARKET
jgi:hypothetical protein